MNNPKSRTLFHFTKEAANFYSILENGLKFAYCEERYNNVFHYALPMICFCDMPLSMIGEHVENYGAFGIGLKKRRMINTYWKILNPVNYIFSKNLLDGAEKFLELAKSQGKEHDDNSLQLYRYATKQLAYMKPYYSPVDKRILYNESEWRFVIPDKTKIEGFESINWFWEESEYTKFKAEHSILNTNLPFLNFTPDDVQFILVDDIRKRDVIIDRILNMKTFGGNTNIQDFQRKELLTKIIFLDEIKANY